MSKLYRLVLIKITTDNWITIGVSLISLLGALISAGFTLWNTHSILKKNKDMNDNTIQSNKDINSETLKLNKDMNDNTIQANLISNYKFEWIKEVRNNNSLFYKVVYNYFLREGERSKEMQDLKSDIIFYASILKSFFPHFYVSEKKLSEFIQAKEKLSRDEMFKKVMRIDLNDYNKNQYIVYFIEKVIHEITNGFPGSDYILSLENLQNIITEYINTELGEAQSII